MMDFQKSFTYQFEDKQWASKLGLGALISLVPILNLATIGYAVELIRNVANQSADPLPNWDDFGEKFRDGLTLTAALLIYAAPAIILICLPLGVLLASGFMSQNDSLQGTAQSLSVVGAITLWCFMLILLMYSLALSILRPVILILFSRDGTFASCFKIREALDIVRRRPGPFFMTWVAVILAGFIIGLIVGFINLVLGWIPCLGWIVGLVLALGTAVYLLTVDAHLFGQFRLMAGDTVVQQGQTP